MTSKTWTAALIVIGDEILSGRTQDRNIAQIANVPPRGASSPFARAADGAKDRR